MSAELRQSEAGEQRRTIDPAAAAFWASAVGVILWTLPLVNLGGGGFITIDLREIAMFGTVFGALILVAWRGKLALPRERELWVIFALFVWAGFSMFWARWDAETIKGLIRFAGWIGFGLVVVLSMRDDRYRRRWVWVLEVAAAIILMRVSAAYVRAHAVGPEGWEGMWNQAVAFTRYAETALPFMVYFALKGNSRQRLGGLIGILICVAIVVMLRRRGSLVVVGLMLPLLALMLRRLRGREPMWILGVLVALSIGIAFQYPTYARRFRDMGDVYRGMLLADASSDMVRLQITLTMIDLARENPWLGIGWENFKNTYMQRNHVEEPAFAHYLLFRYQVELGVVGTLLGVIWVVLTVRRVDIARRRAGEA
ncbi:MAG: hypothetical protein GF393_11760, partial [Armatimonadia bacterium]|nr:hypothetical protein [Armatimonadia bacterium]